MTRLVIHFMLQKGSINDHHLFIFLFITELGSFEPESFALQPKSISTTQSKKSCQIQ